jgi:hypothetical protein
MTYRSAVLAAAILFTAAMASAQDVVPGPGAAEVTLIPGGGIFFVDGDVESSFGNYNVGGAFTYNINRHVGIEGEFGGMLGITQDLTGSVGTNSRETPSTLGYMGNIVFSAPAGHGAVPFLTGGIGGLTMLKKADLAVDVAATFLTSNVGGGVRWYANRAVGLRADYRFLIVYAKDNAAAFFGAEHRHGHRLYAGLVLNVGR